MRTTSRFNKAGALAAAVLGSVATLGVPSAMARDNGGIQQFFSDTFGFGAPAREQPQPYYDLGDDGDRPLVVRPHRKRVSSKGKAVEVAKGPYQPISIYNDSTLRPGDAVMMAGGMRIFVGRHSLPYSDQDFVAVSDAGGVSKNVQKALVAINQLPRN